MKVEVKRYFMFYGYEFFRGDILRFEEENNPYHDYIVGRIYTEENIPFMHVTKNFFQAYFKAVKDS